jgi:hypothetical protein
MHIIYRSANKYPEIPGLTPWVDCPGANSHSHRHCQCHLGGIGLLGEDDEQKALISTAKVGEKTLVNLQKLQVNQRDDQGDEDNHQVEF